MGYTLSFTASVKVGRGGVAGLLHHDARDVDRAQGREVRHSNQDIDPARTPDNETIVSDGQGGWMPCSDISQIEDAIEARLSHVTKPLRKDAVVLRPLVLQLDPDWYAAHPDEEERGAAAEAMLEWAADTFGPQNVVYAAIHRDEGNQHLHVGICPVTSDGRLAQKDWFSGPAALRQMHDDFRHHMQAEGYDIEMQRKKPGKHARRMDVQEYKDFCDLQAEARKIDSQQGQLSRWADRLRAQQADLDAREARVQQRERAVAAKEKQVQQMGAAQNRREAALEAREGVLAAQADQVATNAAKAAIRAAEAQKRAASEAEARAAAAAAIQRAMGYVGSVQQQPPGQHGPGYSL